METKRYRQPRGTWIPREGHEKLYGLEERRDEAFRRAANQLGAELGQHPQRFYFDTLPEAMLSMLEAWDNQAVGCAVRRWLELHPEEAPKADSDTDTA